MSLFQHNSVVGLDIGQANIKAVQLSEKGDRVSIEKRSLLDCRNEGILDENELCAELPNWIAGNAWRNEELVLQMPQFLASTQVSDFPPRPGEELADMVRFETQHLAGLSEEPFIHDFQQMPEGAGRNNPVLIGICKESVSKERSETFSKTNLRVSDFALDSTALASAYLNLYPDAQTAEAPQVLIDIGAENSVMAILLGSRILFTSSLMFGVDTFLQNIAQQLGVNEEDAWQRIQTPGSLGDTEENSPFSVALYPLVNEIESALEQWRANELAEVRDRTIEMVSVSGGGACLPGIDAFLGEALDCSARTVGVPTEDAPETPDPVYMIAYGLALHGLGQSYTAISLAPPEICWHATRRKRFKFLAVGVALLLCVFAATEIQAFFSLHSQRDALEAQLDELDDCEKVVHELETKQRQIVRLNNLLVPLVEKGNHAGRFLVTLQRLGKAKTNMLEANKNQEPKAKGWLIYLADRRSFEKGKGSRESSSSASKSQVAVSPFSSAGSNNTSSETQKKTVDTTQVQPWEEMVAALYTTAYPEEPYRLVKTFIGNLEPSRDEDGKDTDPLFKNVDLMKETNVSGREDIFVPWIRAFNNTREEKKYRYFTVNLPYRSLDVKVNRIE